ncbi:MAG: response regulator transcription factor [Saprospiraceae bacterium]|nr:response regulator transcription factor [Saprospiraceae bacterium]
MVKILYLEDEHYLGRIVKESLASRGYDIKLVTDGNNLMHQFEHFVPDICVLDIMVPNIDGYTLSKSIRERDADMPIIFLSAKNQTQDVLKGFESGGNDYLKKPFSMEELIVRIENLLQLKSKVVSAKSAKKSVLGDYVFLYHKFELRYKDEKVTLSHRENELLKMLDDHRNQKIDRRDILKNVWGDDSLYNSRNLDVYIRKLRVYLEKDPRIQLVTLRGIGYHFIVED